MKKSTLILTLALGSLAAFGQTHDHEHTGGSDELECGEAIETNRLKSENPDFASYRAHEEASMQAAYVDFMESWSPEDRSTYVVPIVVHVVHIGGSENISDEQIYSGIEQLNLDFNGENPDLGGVIDEFSDITGNHDIEFRLATKDPSGNCHPGITRTFSSTTYDTGLINSTNHPIIDAIKDEHGTWPQNEYMNIVICIDPNGNGGYTYRPTNWFPANDMYGSILIRSDFMGIIGTSNASRRHILSHEAGHWLDLPHTWGGTNTPGLASNCGDDDGIMDTPNTVGWSSCGDVYSESCGSLDNLENIMDYASSCRKMFTEGQSARVQSALTGGTAQRNNLFTAANLVATGTDGPGELCQASFISNTRTICEGASIDFSDVSFHTVTSRDWDFEGGSPSSSTSENPTITYNTPGVYAVTLNASNGGSTETLTAENYVIVLPSTGVGLPYSENFESMPSITTENRFVVENNANDATWEITTTDAGYGSRSAGIQNFGINNNSKDALVSETIDLSSVSPSDDMVFTFKYAYERRDADNDEWIRVFISNDCGESWVLRKNVHGDDLGPEVSGSEFEPNSIWDWRQVNITTISADYYVSNFRYKIEFQNNDGNNIYIDEINLYPASMASIVDTESNGGLTVYPNPMEGETTVELNAVAGEEYNIALYNALGEKLTTVYTGELTEGKNTIQFNTDNLAKGIYILRVETQGTVETIKLIKD